MLLLLNRGCHWPKKQNASLQASDLLSYCRCDWSRSAIEVVSGRGSSRLAETLLRKSFGEWLEPCREIAGILWLKMVAMLLLAKRLYSIN
jgi:hypothetical protein